MESIYVSKVADFLSNFNKKLLIIGQPKGVGLTTEVISFFAEKLFYEESYSVLILARSYGEKLNIIEIFNSHFKNNFDYDITFSFDTNVLYVFDNFAGIVVEDEKASFNTSTPKHAFNYLYIDKDDQSDIVNYYLEEILPNNCEKGIIATYDTPDSIFYMPDAQLVEKIIVHSERSKENIQKLNELGSYTDGYGKIIKGLFNEEID